jgi:hypothetical protein
MLDAAIIKPTRRPRFRRSADPPVFQLTERDIEIVRQVARHRFLRSTHISRLLDGSHKKLCERLTLLYHAGYLDRPRSQLEYHVRSGGSAPYVYALGNQGSRLLKECGGFGQSNVDWARKSRDSTRQFLLHTLSIADFRVALVAACSNYPGLRLIEADELLRSAPEQTQQSSNPWSWRVRSQFKGQTTEIGVIPDYVFALILPDGRRRPFVVECDRGTMPIERASPAQTSMLNKFLGYEAAHMCGFHTKRFGWKTFRVLVITTSSERVNRMQALIERTTTIASSPLFLFADHTMLIRSNILAHPWSDGRGNVHTLV